MVVQYDCQDQILQYMSQIIFLWFEELSSVGISIYEVPAS